MTWLPPPSAYLGATAPALELSLLCHGEHVQATVCDVHGVSRLRPPQDGSGSACVGYDLQSSQPCKYSGSQIPDVLIKSWGTSSCL